jgi:hypothetical protein
MPTTTVWLDDDHNVVDRDRATFAVETETDGRGRLVQERWIRIARPDSEFAEEIELRRKAGGTPGGTRGEKRWVWAIAAILILVLAIWLLAR